MADPSTTAFATSGIAATTLISLFPGIDAAVVLGAFSGAVVFVMSSNDMSTAKKIGFFIPSFFGGMLSAGLVSSLIGKVLPATVIVNEGVGAILASSIMVKTLLWILARDPEKMIATIRGVKS